MKPMRVPKGRRWPPPPRSVHELIELDPALGILDDDNRIAELNQIFPLQSEYLLTDILSLLLGGNPIKRRALI